MKNDSDREVLRALNLENIRRSKKAARKLIADGNLEAAKADLEWVETSSQLIAIAERGGRFRLSVLIAFGCLLIAGLAWSLHVCSTQLSLEIVTQNVSFTLTKDWSSIHHFSPESVFIDNVAQVSAPGLIPPSTSHSQKKLTTISLQGKKMIVNEISLMRGARVEMSSVDGKLNLFVKDSYVNGEFFINKADLKIGTGDRPFKVNSEIPETLSFKTTKTIADPVCFELRLGVGDNWILRGLQAGEIGFLEENPPGSGKFESVILSGKVTLPETGEAENLRTTDRLVLKGVKSRRIELSNASNGIHVVFEGAVSEILVGPQGFEMNLTPTYLEYIYHQQRLAFFWSVVVFLWAMFWSIRNTIFREDFFGKG